MKVTLYETIMTFLGQRDPKKQAGNSSALSAGVSLRDYFAGMALRGIMERHDVPGYTEDGAVNEAYRIADIMLERRKETAS